MGRPPVLRMVPCLLGLLGLLVAVRGGKPEAAAAAGGLVSALVEEDRRALSEALRDGRAIAPEKALAAARQFLGAPGAIQLKYYWDQDDFDQGPVYCFEVAGLARGDLEERVYLSINAADGKPQHLSRIEAPRETSLMRVTREDARAIAERFLRVRWPEFPRRRWAHEIEPLGPEADPKVHSFVWTEILDARGVRAAHDLMVNVDRATGRIAGCWFPRDLVGGPTTPRVTLEQAKRLAAPHARHDPARFPFRHSFLQQSVADHGVIHLMWKLYQEVPDAEGPDSPHLAFVQLNATTGKEIWAPNSPGVEAPWWQPLRAEARAVEQLLADPEKTTVEIENRNGNPVRLPVDPEIIQGEVWIRMEILRGLGVRVFGPRKRPELRFRAIHVAAEACGAQAREDGWWIPLNRVARALGWKLGRDQETGAVRVYAPDPPPGRGR